MNNEILQYPIGNLSRQAFTGKEAYSEKLKSDALHDIEILPQLLENAVLNLDETQLNTPYRQDGWTIKQVVHHVADSHMNAYIRFKLALTEDNPTIKPYNEKAWADMSDTKNVPINVSLTLLHSLHIRLIEILKNMQEHEWQRTVFHPEHQRRISLWEILSIYSWHGKHHVAHIVTLRKTQGW